MSNFRVMADVTVNMNQFEDMASNAPEAVANALKEISEEALQIAVENSRIDTGAMSGIKRPEGLNAGWRRSQIGFKSTIKPNNEDPGYRIYNNTINKRGDTYTQFHEFGTSHIDPQPMAGPAVDYINQMLGQKVLDGVNEAIGKSISSVGIRISGPKRIPTPKKK